MTALRVMREPLMPPGQQDEQSREGHPGVDRSLYQQVESPAQESRSTTYQGCDDDIDGSRLQPDKQRDPSPVDQAAEQVPAQLVGTEEVLHR